MKAILVSRRFNPGHISHIEANARLLREFGAEIKYRLHERYFTFPGCEFSRSKARFPDCIALGRGDLFIVWFPSISVLIDIICVRLLTQARVVYVYHEPYTSFASYRRSGFSISKVLRIMAVSFVSRAICNLSHKIILPSERAFNSVGGAKSQLSRYAKINLMFVDEATPELLSAPRSFISYIGTIAEDHAFEDFVGLVHDCISNNRLETYRFLIATRSNIPVGLAEKLLFCTSSGRLIVSCGRPLSNEEINGFYGRSFVVWNAYRRSMQSGVLPKAYMFGTPVIVSSANKSEFFEDGQHGVLIPDGCTTTEFVEAILRIERRWGALSSNCRSFYLNSFDYKVLSRTFMDFVCGPLINAI